MKIIEKDILTVENGIICQSVNAQGKMNSGLAKSVREKWPIVYDAYVLEMGYDKYSNFTKLGKYFKVEVSPNLWIFNIFGQLNYGYDGKRYTDYAALNQAFNSFQMNDLMIIKGLPIYFPFNFGCDRGGASWEIVQKMIDFYFPNAVICKLPDKA